MIEFFKNVFADFILRLMKATGGYDSGMRVVGRCGHVWKNGKPSPVTPRTTGLRKAEAMRMPPWHHHMVRWMAEERRKKRLAEMKPGTKVYRTVAGQRQRVYVKPKAIDVGGELVIDHPPHRVPYRPNGLPKACPVIP